jgi:pilus assembly protein CpaB
MIPAGAAQTEMVGAVTRRSFAQGEPITQASVLQPDGRGFMAAQLDPGFRAVSIAIDPETGVGGYVQPNDRVDVIVTYNVEGSGEGGQSVRSEVVLQDIRVLALDDAVQTQASGDKPERAQATVAVLELGAEDARVLAGADARGNISLALRGVEAETVGMRRPGAQRHPGLDGGSVRVHSFGRVSNGGSQ